MTLDEIAMHLDMSVRNLRDVLKKIGHPAKNPNVDEVRVGYIRHLREQAGKHASQGGSNLVLTQERAKLVYTQRQLAETELAKIQGSLVSRETVTKAAFETARKVRDSMQNIPSRVSAGLSTLDVKGIESKLSDEIRFALKNLCDNLATKETEK